MPIVNPPVAPNANGQISSHFVGLVWQALVTDTADTSSANPSLLTLANQSPSRIQANSFIGATTVDVAGAIAGTKSFPVANAANLAANQFLYLGGTNPEIVAIAPTYPGATATIPTLAPLAFSHPSGSLVSALANVVFQQEPRTVITSPAAYWLISLMAHEYPDPTLRQRAPTRQYEAILTVKIYDASPSRKLSEDVVYRLDYLLNLGEAGLYGTGPLLGTSPRLFVESLELVQGAEPHFDYSTTVHQTPLTFHAKYSVAYS